MPSPGKDRDKKRAGDAIPCPGRSLPVRCAGYFFAGAAGGAAGAMGAGSSAFFSAAFAFLEAFFFVAFFVAFFFSAFGASPPCFIVLAIAGAAFAGGAAFSAAMTGPKHVRA